MFWKADRGIINIQSYVTVKKTGSKLQFGQVKEATTIIRDPFNHTNNCPVYTKYQKDTGSMGHQGY